MGSFDPSLVEHYGRGLQKRGIRVLTKTAVTAVEDAAEAVEPSFAGSSAVARFSTGEALPFGMMVWSAGLAPTRFANGLGLPKGAGGKLAVDEFLRVPGLRGRVFALGDCAVNAEKPLPPLASVAEQQGQYLADCFNESYHSFDPKQDEELPTPAPVLASVQFPFPRRLYGKSASFRFLSVGAMASMGRRDGVLDLTRADVLGTTGCGPTMRGFFALLTWRGVYVSKQLSWQNVFLIPAFWLKARVFGRDVSRF
jgi:NADH dehydrogenase FAD-containing subunit